MMTSADESGRPGDGGVAADGIDRRGNVGKRNEEGGDLNRLWRTSRQTTQGRRRGRVAPGADRRAGRDEGGSRTLRRSAGGCTKRLGAQQGPEGPCGSRLVLVPHRRTTPASRRPHPQCTKKFTTKLPRTTPAQRSHGRGPVPFYPSPSRGVRFIYLFST